MTGQMMQRSRRTRRRWLAAIRSMVAVSLSVSMGTALAVAKPVPPQAARQNVVEPFAVVHVSGSLVRAPDAARAAHMPPRFDHRLDWSLQVDSATAGALYGSSRIAGQAGTSTAVTVHIPRTLGVLGQPVLTTRRRPSRPLLAFGPAGARLPDELAERVVAHAYMRQLLELGALFESEPAGGTGIRRTHFSDGDGEVALTMDAVRSSRTLRDTTVAGRRVHIVRDSTELAIRHASVTPSRFVDVVARTVESVNGTIVGTRLVDAETQRAFLMNDTLSVRGTIESDDGLGGTFSSPLLIASARQSTLRDAFWRSVNPREPFDMVQYEEPPRLAVEPEQIDSLLTMLDSARTIGQRDSVRAMLRPTGRGNAEQTPVIWSRVRARSLAVGDTASIVAELIAQVRSGAMSISPADYAVLRPALADAEAAFRLGIDRELLALDLMDVLTNKPPVLAGTGARPVCTPDGCAAIRSDVRSAQPGLQAVALVAAMVSEPTPWTDSVIARARTNPMLTTRALLFAQGAASYAGASAKSPIPAFDAPYEAWRHWLMGRDSGYVQTLRADTALSALSQRMPTAPRRIPVSEQAVTAIRFAQARTGADYEAALRRHRDTASADTVRELFNTLLIALGDRPYSDDEVVRLLLGPASPERDVARAQLLGLPMRPLTPLPLASDSMASVIGRRMVTMMFADSARARAGTTRSWNDWKTVQPGADSVPHYVLMHTLPDAVRDRAAELGFAPVERGWQLRPGDDAEMLTFEPIRHRGPFAQVAVTQSTLRSRGATRSGGHESGCIYTLVDGPAGWTIVDTSCWVT